MNGLYTLLLQFLKLQVKYQTFDMPNIYKVSLCYPVSMYSDSDAENVIYQKWGEWQMALSPQLETIGTA